MIRFIFRSIYPYLPAILVLAGAILAAGGTFWSGYRQSNFNRTLNKKNEEISSLQAENIRILKGSDLCKFFVPLNIPSQNGKFRLTAINPSDLPIFDVYLNIRSHVDFPMDTPEHIEEGMKYILNPARYELGTLPAMSAKDTDVFLEPGYYQIDIRTRYGKLTEMLKFGPFNGAMGQSYIITDFTGKIYEKSTSPEGFPKVY